MEPGRDDQLAHLELLAGELRSCGFAAELLDSGPDPSIKVTNPDNRQLAERVLCQRAGDGSWCFWWPWQQPIGPAADVAAVTGKIMTVLRSVEGRT